MADDGLHALKARFPGAVITPGDAGYDAARTVLTAVGEPAAVIAPATAQEVAQAVVFARDRRLLLSVRGGGHSGPGFGTNRGGLVIDLRRLNRVTVTDQAAGVVEVGGGAVWEEVARALEPRNLALSSGDTRSVGVGGLTLSGGVGWMVRQYGLTLDRLLECEVVLADGQLVTASATSRSDLFWALRGGGGNFGVVTRFTFRAHPLHGVVSGRITYQSDDLAGLIRSWRDAMRAAPEVLSTAFWAMPTAGEQTAAMVWGVYSGDGATTDDAEAGRQAFAPFLKLPGYQGDDIAPRSYLDVLDDGMAPPAGIETEINNQFMADFTDEAVDAVAAHHAAVSPAGLTIRYVRGAVNRIESQATAFAHRDGEVLVIAGGIRPAAVMAATRPALAREWDRLTPYASGLCGNFINTVTDAKIAQLYPPQTWARLVEVKDRYDPGNLFQQNINIPPSRFAGEAADPANTGILREEDQS